MIFGKIELILGENHAGAHCTTVIFPLAIECLLEF